MRISQISGVVTSACMVAASLPAAAAPAASPTVAAAPAPEGDGEAKHLYNERKYPEAAQAFEKLWTATGTSKYLFNAAMARELAGHESHAYLLLRRYLATPGLQTDEAERARGRLEALRRRAVAVRLVIVPEGKAPAGLVITLERTPSGSIHDAGRVPVEVSGELLAALAVPELPGAFDLFLEPGPWVLAGTAEGRAPGKQEVKIAPGQAQLALALPELPPPDFDVTANFAPPEAVAAGVDVTLTRDGEAPRNERVNAPALAWKLPTGAYRLSARAAGFLPVDAPFVVDRQPVALDVRFVPAQTDPPPVTPPRKGWVIGQAIGGGVLAVGGIALLAVGGGHWRTTLTRYGQFAGKNAADWDVASGNLFTSWKTYAAGAGLLGAGFGLGVGAVLTHFEAKFKKPKVVWGVGAGVGAALAIVGGIVEGRAGSGLSATQHDHAAQFAALADGAQNDFAGATHRGGAGAALLGLGAGVALSSILGLVRKPRAARTSVLPSGTGVVWTGRF